MAIRGHREYVEKQKIEKYVRKHGSYKQLRLRFIRNGKLKPKSRKRTIYKTLKWFGFISIGEYLYYKFKYESEIKNECGTCKHFIGGGDWNLCCDLLHPDYPCGFLCYEDTVACKDYEKGKYEWHYDGSRFTR